MRVAFGRVRCESRIITDYAEDADFFGSFRVSLTDCRLLIADSQNIPFKRENAILRELLQPLREQHQQVRPPVQAGGSKSSDRLTGNWNSYCLTIDSRVPATHLSACGDTITLLFSPISVLTLILRGLPYS